MCTINEIKKVEKLWDDFLKGEKSRYTKFIEENFKREKKNGKKTKRFTILHSRENASKKNQQTGIAKSRI